MHYAELHCLSCFSFQRGASLPRELFAQAKTLGYSALAITDECSLAGIVRAHEAAKATGLKLIVGTELQVEEGPKLVLLAPDKPAYEAMSGIITHARRRSEKGEYRLLRDDFTGFCSPDEVRELFPDEGEMPLRGTRTSSGLQKLLALWIPGEDSSPEHAAWIRETFPGRAWIAVELHRGPRDAEHLAELRALGARFGLPLVAAGDVRYAVREQRKLHDVLTAIHHGVPVAECGLRLLPNGERHLRTLEDLASIVPADLIEETQRIADRCAFSLCELHYEYPRELCGEGTPSQHLRALTWKGMKRRWPNGPPPPKVTAQIERELAIIADMKVEAFFLTVEDIVRWAREQGILCQGRGSAANSAVCYALGITEVNPDLSDMLFERFISKERDEPPDIDVDFEHQRREEVIQYVFRKYGRVRAAIAATVIHYRPKMAIRDVGKALGAAPDQIDAFAKSLAWWDAEESLPQRLRELGLDPDAPTTKLWLSLVHQLVGLPRHLSQHVGGFIISDAPVSNLVPVENAAMPDRTIIQWDKDDLESLGLLKVDVLALGMLSAIRRSLAMVAQRRGVPFGLADIPREDPKTYAMIQRADTIGVFQIESRAQMSMLPRLKPKMFYDLVIEVAIVRPGPIQGGMVHPYLKKRLAKEKDPNLPLDCPPMLVKALGRTLGVPLFQEQVMQIAIDGAGFSPGEADLVRRSMAAWKRNGGLEHFRDRLLDGMARNGFPAEYAERIYQMVLGFGSYGFPESHAASFALLAYASSWLKCHEPAAFFAGLLNSQPMGFYAPAQLVQQAKRDGVTILPVDVTISNWECTLESIPSPTTVGEGGAKHRERASPHGGTLSPNPSPAAAGEGRQALRLGLCLVKGFLEAAARRIESARAQSPFTSLDDLVHRAQLSVRERDVLADADALRPLAGHRHRARWGALGTERLPGLLAGHSAPEPGLDLRAPGEGQEIAADYASVGLTLRRHPVALLRARLDAWKVQRAADLEHLPSGRRIRVAGIVVNRQRPQTAKGTVFMTLEDETGSHNLIVWSSVLSEQRLAALGSKFLIVSGDLQKADGVTHVIVRKFHDASRMVGSLETASRDFH